MDDLGGQLSKIKNPQLTVNSARSPNNNCKIEFFQSLEDFSSWNEIEAYILSPHGSLVGPIYQSLVYYTFYHLS